MSADIRTADAGEKTVEWLMEGDPAVRWQVMRDLLDAPQSDWRAEQRRVAKEGWGAELLSHQDVSGRWTKRFYGKKWISTTYSMALLRRLGLPHDDPRAAKACPVFLDEGQRPDGGIDVSVTLGYSETCVSGMVLAMLSWFRFEDPRREKLVDYLLDEQMPDGGWNCQRCQGAIHSSFHTTISVLEGLREYAEAGGPRAAETRAAEMRGREFFLAHRLYRSHRTGKIVNPAFTRFSFPPRWHHDVLRTLDHFRAASAPYDERLDDPVGVVVKKRGKDGRWNLQNRYPGDTFFEMEEPGQPSRWNTLRALRVLRWYARVRQARAA